MVTPENHRCKRCGHVAQASAMFRVHWAGKLCLFCGECYRELVEQRTGYRQAKLQFEGKLASDSEQAPF